MMKKPSFRKREITLIVVASASLLLAVVAAAYAFNLHHTVADYDQVRNETIRTQSNEVNEQAGYIDTICGEYRKLYNAYKELSVQAPSAGVGYALPGSAKGDVDQCYQAK